ncbi:chymotrypsin-2 [Drosophila innubila]|uniref:chymotrypsin-2 n=1 Tax=Drosophila innubila TaxID=198719 RepID=UPI00148B9EE0|nr:chymotrypsin-2 [Drosophila innubila]
MRTLPKTTLSKGLISLCLCLLFIHLQSLDALRLHGEPFPAQAAISLRSSARISAEREGRITGGDLAALGEWPWIVSVQNQFGFDFCGGVIIDDVWILTAASCVSGLRARNLMVLVGTLSSWNNSALHYFVDQIHVHCNFDKPLYHNDIAMLRLTESIKYNKETAKISLSEVDELQEGDKLSFAGWGTTTAEGSRSQYLQQSQGNYLSVDKCRTALGETEDVDLGHVCVQMEKGKGICYGDTGGPLINSQGQLVGIGNWGVPCGRGYPDVYARVPFYHDWIRTIINGCGKV